ncbi:MAG: MATE family efflux transporter, partial [Rhizobiales bacterium]|nr:MATE family efflux transporter [Hyphomicrobiales bacterium]
MPTPTLSQPPPRSFAVTHRGILAIALPMTLAYLSTPLLGFADVTVIGRLGDAALIGGIALGAVIFDFLGAVFYFLRSGTTGFTAQALGAGDRTEIEATLFRALLVGVVCGLAAILVLLPLLPLAVAAFGASAEVSRAALAYCEIRILATPFMLVGYVLLGWLLGLGRSGAALMLQTVLNGLNILLNIVLVIGFSWGITGTAAATAASEVLVAGAGLALVLRGLDRRHRPGLSRIVDRAALIRMVAVNRDIMIRSFVLLFGFAFFAARGAAFGDTQLAANAMLMNFFLIGAYFLDGFAAAAEQYAGRAVGAGDRGAFERSVRLTLVWGYGLAIAAAAILFLAGPALIDFMTVNEAVRRTARDYLVFAAITPIAGVLAFQMDGVFIGATWSADMRNMMLLSLVLYLAVWAVAEPLLGPAGLWLALLVFLSARGLSLAAVAAAV